MAKRHSVYIGSSLLNVNRTRYFIAKFNDLGIGITYDWTKHGQLFDPVELTKCAAAEINGVRECDVFFMLQPGRSGTHCELGMAIALHKPIIILEDCDVLEEKAFYYAPTVQRFTDESSAVAAVLSELAAI